MRKLNTCELLKFDSDAHEAGDDPVSERRTVKVQELEMYQSDRTEAGAKGHIPEAKLLIPYDKDYEGEREMDYEGERWEILNADPSKDWNGVVLRIRRKNGNESSAGR